MRTKALFLLFAMLPIAACAEGDQEETKKSQNFLKAAKNEAKGKPLLLQPLYWIKTVIDSSAVATVDCNYIEQPKRPWAAEVRSEISESQLKMTTTFPAVNGGFGTLTSKTSNGFSASAGAWVGYRGYGFGLSKELTNGSGSTLSFGAMGGSFGINFRINSYDNEEPNLHLLYSNGAIKYEEKERVDLDDPISVRSLFLDGYYMFNGKHFSYAAAYDQSLIQRRSAGSLMAGLMYYHTRVSFDEPSNWPLLAYSQGVGKLKFTQACVGAGYAYNWVPARGWLVNVMAMPMLQFYNRISAYNYRIYMNDIDVTDLLIADFSVVDEGDDYSDDDSDDDFYESIEIRLEENGVQKTKNRLGLNFDARLSVVYNWSNYYFRLYGHYNRFRYSNDTGNGRLAEWRVYGSFGFRF